MIFPYYGCKKQLAKHYPLAMYPIIIEPFCGSAEYSLRDDHFQKEVLLYDKYKVITDLWHYLISIATPERILSLPEPKYKESIEQYKDLSIEERYLIGFCINRCSATPKKTVQMFDCWPSRKRWISNNLHRVRHWTIFNQDYHQIENIEATWFIDPPYQFGGQYYHSSANNKHIDFNELAEWCKSRRGQVIVCENSGRLVTISPFS